MVRVLSSLVLVAVCLVSTVGFAAEPVRSGAVSKQRLSALGLGGMTAVSDAQGAQVRGMGAIVFGGSYVNLAPNAGAGNAFIGFGATAAGGSSQTSALVQNGVGFVSGISGTQVYAFGF